MIDAFYAKVRSDPVLGPVFDGIIKDDWAVHIERIRLGLGYDGRGFMPAHLRHDSIRPEHLPRWLLLFRETAREICPPAAAEVLIDIAERVAESIRISLARHDGGAV